MDDEKRKQIEELEARLASTYGESAPAIPGESGTVEVVSTGIPALDIATGVGGLPRGRIVEVYGAEGSGKTAVALAAIAECQRNGGVAGFIDAECALTPSFAEMFGVNMEELLLSRPEKGEDALAIMEDLAESKIVDIIALDSVASLITEQELTGDYGDANVAALAKFMSGGLKRLAGVMSKSNAVALFVNQLRSKPEIGFSAKFAPKEQSAGGRALRFYASMRIEVKTGQPYVVQGLRVGHRCRCYISKNKVAPPFETCEWDLFYRRCTVDGIEYEPGLDWLGAAIDGALASGVIIQRSSFYYFTMPGGEEIKANGLKAFRKQLTEPKVLEAFWEAMA